MVANAALRADRALLARLPTLPPQPPRRVGPSERRDPYPPEVDAGATAPARAQEREAHRTVHAAMDARAIRVNVGGPEVTAGGVVWAEDRYVDAAGAVFSNHALEEVGGTEADAVYRSERNTGSDAEGALLRYVVPLPDGSYRVVLHFAEIYFGTPGNPEAEPGQRVFDVELDGERVLEAYDVFVAAGGAARAVTESFVVVVDDGSLVLTVRNGIANRGKLSAFEIVPLDAGG